MLSTLLTAPPELAFETVSLLRRAFQPAGEQDSAEALTIALKRVCEEGRERAYGPEQIVVALRRAWHDADPARARTLGGPDREYYSALGQCMRIYFRATR